MKILFLARHYTYFRNYESVIAILAARGHHIHLAAEREEDLGGRKMVERLAQQHQGVTFGWVPAREDAWGIFATRLRMTIDYLRYLDPAYADAPKLRARARERVPRAGLWLVAAAGTGSAVGRHLLRTILYACERAIPRSRQIDDYLREQRPDVVLFTPLIGLVASPQLDYLQSAKALGYPTALCVWSWDHLSSKAILRNVPDRVFVWNDTQRDEALSLHRVASEQVVVTGAQCFDQWFDRTPSMTREAFRGAVGLGGDGPFLLYVCSALFQGSPTEALFVQRWIQAVRASKLEPLASMPIVVRPHPARTKEWEGIDVTTNTDVVLWGRNPVDPEAKAGYFDSLAHCAAVVGLNTSAFLEGAIAGKPVFATLLPEHFENQEGTIHFHYLLKVGGGLLHTARSLEEQCRQINDVLLAGETSSRRSQRFVEAFIRPRGLDVAASPVFADSVEGLAASVRVPAKARSQNRVLQRVLEPVVSLAAHRVAEPLVLSEHERAIMGRQRAHRARVEAAWRVKDAHNEAEQQRKDARVTERERYKAERAAEWRRTKTMKKFTQRLRKRIGLTL
ncbi:MAG: hypothetical protein HOP16_12655 [Acidobacteria bacterium]|nr:hypothetical protein [Acidobacteriota bacterium]